MYGRKDKGGNMDKKLYKIIKFCYNCGASCGEFIVNDCDTLKEASDFIKELVFGKQEKSGFPYGGNYWLSSVKGDVPFFEGMWCRTIGGDTFGYYIAESVWNANKRISFYKDEARRASVYATDRKTETPFVIKDEMNKVGLLYNAYKEEAKKVLERYLEYIDDIKVGDRIKDMFGTRTLIVENKRLIGNVFCGWVYEGKVLDKDGNISEYQGYNTMTQITVREVNGNPYKTKLEYGIIKMLTKSNK